MKFYVKQLPTKLDPLEQYESWNEASVWALPWTEVAEDDYTLLVLAGSVKHVSVAQVSAVDGIKLHEPATWIYA